MHRSADAALAELRAEHAVARGLARMNAFDVRALAEKLEESPGEAARKADRE